MGIGKRGYVGLVRIEDGRLNVAAALDVGLVQTMGGLPRAACQVLKECGFPVVAGLATARWQGTPPLTRRYQPPPSRRLFLVGDAAEYIEPFTGEGMAWAAIGGAAVVGHVVAALRGESPAKVTKWHRSIRQLLGWRKWQCRVLTGALRAPRLTGFAVRLLRACPQLAAPYLFRLNRVHLSRG
jgi:flavin-dependent dehydrogenase